MSGSGPLFNRLFRHPGDRIPDMDAADAQIEREHAPASYSPATHDPVTVRHVFTEIASIKKELRAGILPEWEIMGPYTIGGAVLANTPTFFRLDSPFQTTCEYQILQVSRNSSAGTGLVSISKWPSVPTPVATSAPKFDQGDRLEGLYFSVGVNDLWTLTPIWYPLPANGSLYLSVNLNNASAFYTSIAFRRKRDKQAVYYE